MLKRSECVGGSKNSETQMGRGQGGKSPEKYVIELCGSVKHQH